MARWRGDGKEFFFLAVNRIVAVDVALRGGEVQSGQPHPLFDLPGAGPNPWDVSADGQRFLNTAPSQNAAADITLIQNWAAGLKK